MEDWGTSSCQILSKLVYLSLRYCSFSNFKDGRCHHLAFSNLQNFIGWRCLEGWVTSKCQILSKSFVLLWRYCKFSNVRDGRRRHVGFGNYEILLSGGIQRVKAHEHAKLCQNRSVGYDRCSSFDNMNVLIFGAFGRKMPIMPQKLRFMAIWLPKWAVISAKAKNGTPLRESASFEPSSVKIRLVVWPCWWVT